VFLRIFELGTQLVMVLEGGSSIIWIPASSHQLAQAFSMNKSADPHQLAQVLSMNKSADFEI